MKMRLIHKTLSRFILFSINLVSSLYLISIQGGQHSNTYSELFIHRSTQCKGSEIVEHTTKDMIKRITGKILVLETPIDGVVQQRI